jgi:DNA-binding NarL/FixJ family response regulator
MRDTITVLLADDHRILSKGVKSLLSDKARIGLIDLDLWE